MIDLNDLRVFERVAASKSFSAASCALGIPKSSVSRGVRRLEAGLGTPLLHRTTREVALTEAGSLLHERCAGLLDRLDRALDEVGSLRDGPRGRLRVTAGIGFGVFGLADVLPAFAQRYPEVEVVLDLSSDLADLVGDGFDVAIRFGDLADSSLIAKRLGLMNRYLCASPGYLARRGTPATFEELRGHDIIAFPNAEGRAASLTFRNGGETVEHRQKARFSVNDAQTIHRLILNGIGIGPLSGHLCGPEIQAGRLVRLLVDWSLLPMPVHVVFPAHREQTAATRAFIESLQAHGRDGFGWQADPIASIGSEGTRAVSGDVGAGPLKTNRPQAMGRAVEP